jgi:hypothetical protein
MKEEIDKEDSTEDVSENKLIYQNKQNEVKRYCKLIIKEKQLYQTQEERETKLEDLMRTHKELKDFFIGFMSECNSTYMVGVLIARSNLDLAFQDNITITFLSFLLKRIPVVGGTFSDILKNYVQSRMKDIITQQAEQMIRFSPAPARFEKRYTYIINQLMLQEGFLDLLRSANQEVELNYMHKMEIIINKLFYLDTPKSNAELLGKSLAQKFFNHIVFKSKGETIENDNIISFLLNCLEFNYYNSTLPPEMIMNSEHYSCFYSGFLSMTEMIFEVAESSLLSCTPKDGRSIILKRFIELRDEEDINFVDRAADLTKFFRNKNHILEMVEKTFKICVGEVNGIGSSLVEIVNNIFDLKFGTRNFFKMIQKYWEEKSLPPYKPIVEMFDPDVKYEIKVGALCAFHIIGMIKYDEMVKVPATTMLLNGFNQLNFEKKGFFSKLKNFYTTNRQRNIDDIVMS